jgi:hypothetical protein
MQLGAVFRADWSNEPVRVIAFDRHVVMYDTWWSHKSSWGMSKLSGKFSYYRLHRDHFEKHTSFLRFEPLGEQEKQVHRPDLPFSFATHRTLSWYGKWPSDLPVGGEQTLLAPAIYLAPFGPRDSAKPSVLVHAANGHSFAEAELLVVSKSIQDPHIRELPLTEGVGIYRLGIQRRLPVYYLWGARSRLDA